MIPTGYVAQAAVGRLEFNLTNRNITEVLPDAFIARGAHQKVRSISLRGNHLTELPEGLFRDLLQQEEDDWRNDIDTVDLADNRIATLPPGLFQAGSSGESTVIGDLHLEGNCLTTLPPGVFHGLTFQYPGQTASWTCPETSCRPPKVFACRRLSWSHLFTGQNGILDISQNKLQALQTFHGLTLTVTSSHPGHVATKQLQVLHADAFHGLTFGLPRHPGHLAQPVAGVACRSLSWSHIW